jgi:hypothetical protein
MYFIFLSHQLMLCLKDIEGFLRVAYLSLTYRKAWALGLVFGSRYVLLKLVG